MAVCIAWDREKGLALTGVAEAAVMSSRNQDTSQRMTRLAGGLDVDRCEEKNRTRDESGVCGSSDKAGGGVIK